MALDYFTLEEVRALPDMNDATRFTPTKVDAASAFIEDLVERLCGTSFVAREVIETLDGNGGTILSLKTPYVLSVETVTVNGVVLTDEFTVDAGLLERRTAGTFTSQPWTRGRRNITVTYQSGYSTQPPFDLKSAMLQGTRYRLLSFDAKSGLSDRAMSITNEFGNVNLATSNADGRPTGLPEVDAVIMGWARKTNTVTYP